MVKPLLLAAAAGCAALVLPAFGDGAPSPAAAVDAFHSALKSGDAAAVQRWLATDVDIFEQGFVDHGRANYAGAHLAADSAFAQATTQTVLERHTLWFSDSGACVLSQTRTKGSFQGHPIDLIGTETVLLQRGANGWSISHIHWSAHPGDGALQPATAPKAK